MTEDVKTEESAASAEVATTEVTESSPAEASNTDKTPQTVPYERISEVTSKFRDLEQRYEKLESDHQNLQQFYSQGQSQQNQVQKQPDQLEQYLGSEVAGAVRGELQKLEVNQQRAQFEMLYKTELDRGSEKFGEDFSKQTYKDPQGVVRNKVVDALAAVNPVTGKPFFTTLDQAYRAVVPLDEQTLKDKFYQEMQQKEKATPDTQTTTPASDAPKQARSIAEAVEMAMEQHK